jgi:hypothetical protein
VINVEHVAYGVVVVVVVAAAAAAVAIWVLQGMNWI